MIKPSSTSICLGLTGYLLGGLCLRSHINSDLTIDETSSLINTSQYLQQYKGTNICDTLYSVKDNIHALNDGRNFPELTQLEDRIQEVSKISDEKTDSYIKKSLVSSFAKDISQVAEDRGRTGAAMAGAVCLGLVSTLLSLFGFYSRNKPDDNWDD